MLFSFLLYDQINFNPFDEENPQITARVFFWMAAIAHTALTITKIAEWIGNRMELEHVHPHWMIFPVGLSVAALLCPIIPLWALDNSNSNDSGSLFMAIFFQSFAYLMWIVLFVITFFKVVTQHNSDPRVRHGVWIWLAAPCVIGLADAVICRVAPEFDGIERPCKTNFAQYYFIGLFLFLIFVWATFPYIAFFGRDQFGMGYWMECFSLDVLAACAASFYGLTDFGSSITLMYMGLTIAAIANHCALMHMLVGIVRRRGVFTPEGKWGPLSFMKLTHEAFRGNMATLRACLEAVDMDDTSRQGEENLGLLAAHLNRFVILHQEHSKHEDEVIFKTFNDYFQDHCKKWNDDHSEDHQKLEEWCKLANKLLDADGSSSGRKDALATLKKELPPFFDNFLEHLKGEEDNLNPVGRKHLPLELQKQVAREVWRITPAEKWEIIVPYIVNNLPRHMQRVRYLKVLCWSMPERAQQIGAIVYRNVDPVMWERLRTELPEIIPRSAPNWRRYY